MNQRIRTVVVNEKGQVTPKDIRKDLEINKNSTIVLIEKNGEITLKKSEISDKIEEDKFWKALTKKAIESAWEKEDIVWEKIYKEEKK